MTTTEAHAEVGGVDISADQNRIELRKAVRAIVRQWRDQQRYELACDNWMKGFDPEFSRELAARGLLGINWPTEYGGQARAYVDRFVVTEELLRAGAPVAAHWMGDRQIGPTILKYGSEELKHHMLPMVASGRYSFCLGMSEPESGSDLASVRTRAEKVPGGWSIHGSKIWTTNAHRTTHGYLLARSRSTDVRHEGLTEFIVDMADPAITVRPIMDMSGEHHFNEVFFDGAFCPDEWVIGEVDNGWSQVTEQLAFERGGCERFLTTYPLFAKLLQATSGAQDRAIRELVADLVTRLMGLRQLSYQFACSVDAGAPALALAAQVKFLGPQFERDVVRGARYIADVLDLEQELAGLIDSAEVAVTGASIRGGASDILLGLIARDELRVREAAR
jgi:alkylation response protein AidB-like acyl-CoA dehydrogenase